MTTATTTTTGTHANDDQNDDVVPGDTMETTPETRLQKEEEEDIVLSTMTTMTAPPYPPTASTPSSKTNNKSRAFERWLFTDWLNTYQNKKTKKEPAIPVLKSAKWNSGDNPVLVTAAMMMVGIIIASWTEREWQI